MHLFEVTLLFVAIVNDFSTQILYVNSYDRILLKLFKIRRVNDTSGTFPLRRLDHFFSL